jgi:hypothetical protein
MSYRKFVVQDILTAPNGEPLIANGDFVIGQSDKQHIDFLLKTNKGEWRFAPLVGCGLLDFINSVGADLEMKRIIRNQLEQDGYRVDELQIQPSGLKIEAFRIR